MPDFVGGNDRWSADMTWNGSWGMVCSPSNPYAKVVLLLTFWQTIQP